MSMTISAGPEFFEIRAFREPVAATNTEACSLGDSNEDFEQTLPLSKRPVLMRIQMRGTDTIA